MWTVRLPGLVIAGLLCLSSTPRMAAAEQQHCVRAEIVLWGDNKHDDTFALNAWLRGEDAIWADSGARVGATISGRRFRLSAPIYVRAGTGRTLRDFRLEWPERGEIVSGGTVEAGPDPDAPPALSAISIVGGDRGEGIPFDMPDHGKEDAARDASCATS